jgi:hypothetical protein
MKNENEYEPYSAVTFLLLGLGIGDSFGSCLHSKMRQRVKPEGINSWRTAWCATTKRSGRSESASSVTDCGWDVTTVYDLRSLAGGCQMCCRTYVG